jgi:hypothetical protein
VLDTISELSSYCKGHVEDGITPSILRNLSEHVRWLREADGMIDRHYPDLGEHEKKDLLWRICVGDRDPTARPADLSSGLNFDKMRKFAEEFQAVVDANGTDDLPGLMQAIRNHGPFAEIATLEEAGKLIREMLRGDAIFSHVNYQRRLAITEHMKALGMVPYGTKIGDIIALIWGSEVPFVLRKSGTHDKYQIIGECYVHGFMDGEGSGYIMRKCL